MIAKLLLCAALFQDPVAVVTPAGDPVALRVEAIPGVRVRAAWLALPLAPAADIDGAAMRRLFAECLRASLPPATAVEPTRVIAGGTRVRRRRTRCGRRRLPRLAAGRTAL